MMELIGVILVAMLTGLFNLWLAMKKPTVDQRVNYLVTVAIIDALMVIGYNVTVGDPMLALLMSVKYLWFSLLDFNRLLRKNL